METSKEWFTRAERVMPGGVNSPVRACRAGRSSFYTIAACAAALEDTDPARRDARMEAGKDSSWDARVEQMCRLLRQQGVF